MSQPNKADLTLSIDRGVEFIRQKQEPNGSWLSMEYFEPRTSSLHLVTLHFIDRVPLVEARATARFLATLQLDDGSFPPYPFADEGDLSATALTYAALYIADLDEQKPAREKAMHYIEQNGGFNTILKKLIDESDMTALYLSMAGLLDPFTLPDPSLAFLLVPGSITLMLKKLNAGVIEGALFLNGVTRYLREQIDPSSEIIRLVHGEEAEQGIEFIESWLNPNGNNNGTTVQTDQAIATLFALGRTPESTSVYSALQWFNKHKIWEGNQLHLRAFMNQNWMTALCLRALLNAEVPRSDEMIANGLDYLCWSQSKLPMPKVNLSRENAHRTGGWGFEEDNLILPDTDDTGTVLSALGLALDRTHMHSLDDKRENRTRNSVQSALQNVLDMQSDDGGWAGFVWNLPSKKAGPLFEKPIAIPQSLWGTLQFFANPPVELGNPPVSGLSGRVLQGLGANGYNASSPEVQAAAKFLQAQQMESGMWWARWFVAYLASTSCVISGLADCDWNMQESWVQKGIDWLLSKQNKDGGWGETPKAYDDEKFAGIGSSMPPLTGIVLTALIDAGLAESEAVQRGVQYLLDVQDPDSGTWPSNEWLQVYEPNNTYYFYEGAAWYRPVEALSKYRVAVFGDPDEKTSTELLAPLFSDEPPDFPPRKPNQWPAKALEKMRQFADPVADNLMRSIYDENQQDVLRQIMGTLMRSDEPIPKVLPEKARQYFKETEDLPEWADLEKIEKGQKLFTDHGWLMAAGLFCSSLPQSYCSAKGALVLTQTQGMTRHVRARILETAQFLFDVCNEGGLAPGGRGIRTAQKVRLMHATIRHLVLLKGEWNVAELGLPINQEDYAGTLMTFSVVILDALETAGIHVDNDEKEAYLHLWKVVGHLLGIHESLLPVNVKDGHALMESIRKNQWHSSEQGQLLAADLVNSMAEYLPGDLFDELPTALIRFFTPKKAATLLKLPKADLLEGMLDAGAALEHLWSDDDDETRLEHLIHLAARNLMEALVNVQREGKQAAFRIPTSLTRGWGLNDSFFSPRAS